MTYPFFENEDSGVICGGKRSNKTRHMTYLVRLAFESGYKIYANYDLVGIPYIKLSSENREKLFQELEIIMNDRFAKNDFPKSFLALDEIQQIMHSQDWKNSTRYAGILNQLGKCGFTTYGTSPTFDQVYNVYRENCNKRVLCQKLNLDIYKCIIQKQDILSCKEYKTLYTLTLDGSINNGFYKTRQRMYI